MNCPVCRHPMIAVEYQQIELDYCPNCHGSWFDKDELFLLLERLTGRQDSALIRNLLALPPIRTTEQKRKCPVCNAKMRKLRTGDPAAVLLDACEKGDGLWFDGGEVDQLVQAMDSYAEVKTEHDHVFNFMKDVFKSAV